MGRGWNDDDAFTILVFEKKGKTQIKSVTVFVSDFLLLSIANEHWYNTNGSPSATGRIIILLLIS